MTTGSAMNNTHDEYRTIPALSAKLWAAHAAMQCAMSEWALGKEIDDADTDRLRIIASHCDQMLNGERPRTRLDGAAEAYRKAHG